MECIAKKYNNTYHIIEPVRWSLLKLTQVHILPLALKAITKTKVANYVRILK